MNITDALYEYAKTEIVPMIAGDSPLTAGLINGALRASRKKINIQIADNAMLKAIGIVQDNGEIDQESLRDFFDGVFEGRENLPVSLADLLKTATGISSDSELLQDTIKFTRADADRFLDLLAR
jgi:hypothetical protein